MISNASTNFSVSALNLLINNRFQRRFNLFAAWEFCWKTRFEASRIVFWSLSYYKEIELTKKPFTGRALRSLPFQMQNTIGFRSSRVGFKVTQLMLILTFRFSSFLLRWLFSPTFFSFAGHLLALDYFGEKSLLKRCQDRRVRWKCRRVVEKDFHRNSRFNFICFWPFSPASLSASCSFWHDFENLFLQHKLDDKAVLDRQNWWRDQCYKGRGSAWAVTGGSGVDNNWYNHSY